MQIPPLYIDGAVTIWYICLNSEYRYVQNVNHYVDGNRMGAAPVLAICHYPDDTGYYLFRYDGTWKTITDTYHDSVEAAMAQAAFEYDGLSPEKWKYFSAS